jgi:hypothetical protein
MRFDLVESEPNVFVDCCLDVLAERLQLGFMLLDMTQSLPDHFARRSIPS